MLSLTVVDRYLFLSRCLFIFFFNVFQDIVKGLKEKGHGMIRYSNRMSIVCAIYQNETGIYANADFRKNGDVSGID